MDAWRKRAEGLTANTTNDLKAYQFIKCLQIEPPPIISFREVKFLVASLRKRLREFSSMEDANGLLPLVE